MITTVNVLRRGPARFTQSGQCLPYSLHDTDETISAGLVARLRRYAAAILQDAGFPIETWACEVYTMDAEDRPSDRSYVVEFTNAKGGMIGVQGILITNKGWPCLDHGVCCAIGRQPTDGGA